jgi:stage V sporulation protein AA
MVTGIESDRYTSIEIAYSIGLAVGITIFYNHIGGKRLTSDPTPLEVEMRNYESDVNNAIIVMADREKLEKDVE